VDLGDSVSIGTMGLSYLSNLSEIPWDIKITSISNSGLYKCESLAILNLLSIQYIGENAFEGCSNLTKIYLPSNVPRLINTNAFDNGAASHLTLYIPNDSVSSYLAAENWNEVLANIPYDTYAIN